MQHGGREGWGEERERERKKMVRDGRKKKFKGGRVRDVIKRTPQKIKMEQVKGKERKGRRYKRVEKKQMER